MTETDAGAARLRVASALEATDAYDGPLELDLGNLLACDPAPIDPEAYAGGDADAKTAVALAHGRDVLQRLVADLFALPSESDVNGRYVHLPAGTTPLPRTKPLPPRTGPPSSAVLRPCRCRSSVIWCRIWRQTTSCVRTCARSERPASGALTGRIS